MMSLDKPILKQEKVFIIPFYSNCVVNSEEKDTVKLPGWMGRQSIISVLCRDFLKFW